MKVRVLIMIILFGLFTSLAKANQPHGLLVDFQLQPTICITKQVGDPCGMTVTVHWQTSAPADLCLWQNDSEVACWQQQQQVQEAIPISLQKQSTFTLISKNQQTELARQAVNINYQTSQRFRRRLRSQWSIF